MRKPFNTEELFVIDSIRKTASECLPAGSEVILYGSRARGDHHEGSDWDLLLLTDRSDDEMTFDELSDILFPFTIIGAETNNVLSPVQYSKSEWAKYKGKAFHNNVSKDGIKIW